jgi:hypothetical protein
MERSRNSGRNSLCVSIRKVRSQNVLSDTNEHEKAQTTTLSLEALRGIARIVRVVKERIGSAGSDTE